MAVKHLEMVKVGMLCNLIPSLMISITIPRLQSLFDIRNKSKKDADGSGVGFGSSWWNAESSPIFQSQLHQQIYSRFTLV